MKFFAHFFTLAILLTQFHYGLSTFFGSSKPILSYLIQSKVAKIKSGLAGIAGFANNIGGYGGYGGYAGGFGGGLGAGYGAGYGGNYDVEHVHHYHVEPIPVAVAILPANPHHNLAHKSGLYGDPWGYQSSYAWGSHSQYGY